MTTLTVHPLSTDQETDDTAYLLSSTVNAEHLKKSIQQENDGDVTILGLDDVFSYNK